MRLGLLRKEKKKLVYVENPTTTHDIPSAALRRFHEQNLKRAISALHDDPVERRDITSITMAVDVDKLSLAKKRIKAFRREMSELLETGNRSEVYNLTLALFPMTRRKK